MMEDMGAAACAGFGAAEEMWDEAAEAPDAEAEAGPGLGLPFEAALVVLPSLR